MANDEAPTSDEVSPSAVRQWRSGRSQIRVQLVWEAFLLAVAAAVLVLSVGGVSQVSAIQQDIRLTSAAIMGLMALGADLSLRARAPNLAIGPQAIVATMYFLNYAQDRPLRMACLVTLLVVVATGLVTAIAVICLRVPSWVASLGVALTLVAWLVREPEASLVQSRWWKLSQPTASWYAAFAVLAAVVGLLGSTRRARRWLGARQGDSSSRAAAVPVEPDVPSRSRWLRALVATGALMVSSGLAGAAGILFAFSAGSVPIRTGLSQTVLAFGAAMLAGTSITGRRGSVFGIILVAPLLVWLMTHDTTRYLTFSPLVTGVVAIVAGLAVTRLLDTLSGGRAGAPQSPG